MKILRAKFIFRLDKSKIERKPSLRLKAHLAFTQSLPSNPKCQKSLQALTELASKEEVRKNELTERNPIGFKLAEDKEENRLVNTIKFPISRGCVLLSRQISDT